MSGLGVPGDKGMSIDELMAHLDELAQREARLDAALRAASRRIVNREKAIECTIQGLKASLDAVSEKSAPGAAPAAAPTNDRFAQYQRLVSQIKEIIAGVTPLGSTVLVASKGDSALLELDRRHGWHFPQDDVGTYAGYHPADGAAAVAHFEALRRKGATYLVFPNPAFWWLEYYAELRKCLDGFYERIWADNHCIIYDLRARPHIPAQSNGAAPGAAAPGLLTRRVSSALRNLARRGKRHR
jgi:hypothetical protein